MRNAKNAKVMKIDGQLVGFDLGADYCAEHECGIKGIRREFKLKDNLIGIDKRMVTEIPNTLFYEKILYERMNCCVLALCPSYYGNDFKIDKSDLRAWELYSYTIKNEGIVTAWDERSFAILVTKKYKKELKELSKSETEDFINSR